MTRERLVTAAQAADIFGVNRRDVYRWIEEEDIAAVDAIHSRGRRGSTTVYQLSDLARVAAERHAKNPKVRIPTD